MKLILFNGRPASGKTTLARRVCKNLDLKLICKDDVKEFLFEYLGAYNVAWSQMLGAKTSDFIIDLADGVLANGKSVAVESAFSAKFARPQVEQILKKYPDLEVIEVYCFADPDLLRERFVKRVTSGERHPGHDDLNRLTDTSAEFEPINIGKQIKVDTTNFEKINHEQLISELK
jgi:predicted kinase